MWGGPWKDKFKALLKLNATDGSWTLVQTQTPGEPTGEGSGSGCPLKMPSLNQVGWVRWHTFRNTASDPYMDPSLRAADPWDET